MLVIPGEFNRWVLMIITVSALSVACTSSKQSAKGLSAGEMAYRENINNRAAKIVADLGIPDSSKFYKVRDVIAGQYIDLRDIDDAYKAQEKTIKEKNAENKTAADAQIENAKKAKEAKLASLHSDYIKKLGKHLDAGQIDKVKDGMTYGVFPLTYKAHLDMIPSLKEEEKKYIWDALYEAREKAMDGGSSDEKHAIFGKYKGRINNYLAARGYNLTKEREEWQKRIDAAKKN